MALSFLRHRLWRDKRESMNPPVKPEDDNLLKLICFSLGDCVGTLADGLVMMVATRLGAAYETASNTSL